MAVRLRIVLDEGLEHNIVECHPNRVEPLITENSFDGIAIDGQLGLIVLQFVVQLNKLLSDEIVVLHLVRAVEVADLVEVLSVELDADAYELVR